MKIEILDLIQSYLLDLEQAEFGSVEELKQEIGSLMVLIVKIKLLKEK
jgi:hypothetical protein